MHKRSWPQKIELAEGVVHEVPPMTAAPGDRTELVTDHLPYVAGRQTRDAERQEFAEAWSAAFDIVATAEKSPCCATTTRRTSSGVGIGTATTASA